MPTFIDLFLPDFDQEMARTRQILQALPEDDLTWKPHDKSMTLGRLASHVVEMPNWAMHVVTLPKLSVGPNDKPFNAASKSEIMETFDNNVTAARTALSSTTDADLAHVWTLDFNGQVLMSEPRSSLLRGVVLHHMIHHRGQLSVYLRLRNLPVPGLYGLSADERGM